MSGDGLKVTAELWRRTHPHAQIAALLAWLGEVRSPRKRTMAEWDAVYDNFLKAPAKR